MNILVTGGAGYIGTHTVIELIQNGHSAIVVDNLSNRLEESIKQFLNLSLHSNRPGKKIPYEFAPRRAGDLPEYYATIDLAAKELDWRTELTVDDACRDSWNWQSQNPNGYN